MTATDLLDACGATLVRNRKHRVWRLPNGKTFVESNTPSDRRSNRNSLSVLRRLLGKEGVRMATIGELITAKGQKAPVIPRQQAVKPNGALPPAVAHSIENPRDGMYATKKCKSCEEVRSVHDFRRNRQGRIGVCNDCMFVKQSDGLKRAFAEKREVVAREEAKKEATPRIAAHMAMMRQKRAEKRAAAIALVSAEPAAPRVGLLRRLWNWMTA